MLNLPDPISTLRMYTNLGIRLMPCIRGEKRPLLEDWPNKATADLDQVKAWAKHYPGCNWAAATGEASGIVVFDIDNHMQADGCLNPDGGLSLAFLMATYGPLPVTPVQRHEPQRGYHIFFKYPAGRKIKSTTIAEGVEVKANGRAIMLTPSITRNLPYFWDDEKNLSLPFASLPPVWIDLLEDKPRPQPEQREYTRTNNTEWAAGMLGKLAAWRADDYEMWVAVGMALSELGEAGLALWENFSKQSPKYHAGVCEKKYSTFKPGDGIGLGSLAHWAREDGA